MAKVKLQSKPKPKYSSRKGEVIQEYHGNSKWQDAFYVRAHQLSRQGKSNNQIAEALNVSEDTFVKWLMQRPALKEAVDSGRVESEDSFADFVYRHLPEDLRDLWEEIVQLDEENDPLRRIEKLMAKKGETVQQHLFLYALCESDFDPSAALRKLRITKQKLDKWATQDHNFVRIVDEIMWHKKNFLESSLMRLVRQGEKTAVIFANKTLNSDRGYGNTVKVKHEGNVNHDHKHTLDDLELPLHDRVRILEQVRKKRTLELSPKD